MRIVTVAQMRAIEANAEQLYGLNGETLMLSAGTHAAVIAKTWLGGAVDGLRWLFLIGPGNNGGDGLVMARIMSHEGADVAIYYWKDNRLEYERVTVTDGTGSSADAFTNALTEADVVVDALLGIGHSRPLADTMVELNNKIRVEQAERDGQLRVIALDIPSGLNADTGAVDEGTLAADLTITFGCPKPGLFWYPGAAYSGEVLVASIGLPAELALGGIAELSTAHEIAQLLPKRPDDGNKGNFGKVLTIAGSQQFPGAALLAATAAGRIGAGLVTIATTPTLIPAYVGTFPEATYALLPETMNGRAEICIQAASKVDAVALGPGLSQDEGTQQWLVDTLTGIRDLPDANRPYLVVDADALNLLSQIDNWWQLLPAQSIITPHPGEMNRLFGSHTEHMVSSGGPDRLDIARDCARRWSVIVVLKGAVTIIAGPTGAENERPWLNYAPNPAMATAGAGDVLSGTIAGLLAQGMPPFAAAVAGVAIHSQAGKQASHALGDVRAGMLAGDISQFLPDARATIENISRLPLE